MNRTPGRPLRPLSDDLPEPVRRWAQALRRIVFSPLMSGEHKLTLEEISRRLEAVAPAEAAQEQPGMKGNLFSGRSQRSIQRVLAGTTVPTRDVVHDLLHLLGDTYEEPDADDVRSLWSLYKPALKEDKPTVFSLYVLLDAYLAVQTVAITQQQHIARLETAIRTHAAAHSGANSDAGRDTEENTVARLQHDLQWAQAQLDRHHQEAEQANARLAQFLAEQALLDELGQIITVALATYGDQGAPRPSRFDSPLASTDPPSSEDESVASGDGAAADSAIPSAAHPGARPGVVLGVIGSHAGPALSVTAAHTAGRLLAVTAGEDGMIRIWDLNAGRQTEAIYVGTKPVDHVVSTVVDNRAVILSASNKGIHMWDLASLTLLKKVTRGPLTWFPITALACHTANGKPMAIAIEQSYELHNEGYRVRIWDLTDGGRAQTLLGATAGIGSTISCIDTALGPIAVITGRKSCVRFIHRRPNRIHRLRGGWWTPLEGVACAYLGKTPVAAASTSKHVALWDLYTGKRLRIIIDKPMLVRTCTTIHGQPVLITTLQQHIQAWHLETGKPLCTLTAPDTIHDITTGGPLGTLAVACDTSGFIHVWDLAHEITATPH